MFFPQIPLKKGIQLQVPPSETPGMGEAMATSEEVAEWITESRHFICMTYSYIVVMSHSAHAGFSRHSNWNIGLGQTTSNFLK